MHMEAAIIVTISPTQLISANNSLTRTGWLSTLVDWRDLPLQLLVVTQRSEDYRKS